jgi:hypothetical protein
VVVWRFSAGEKVGRLGLKSRISLCCKASSLVKSECEAADYSKKSFEMVNIILLSGQSKIEKVDVDTS